MPQIFSVALGLGPLEIGVIAFTAIGFIVMFSISSIKGDYKGLTENILQNDGIRRAQKNSNLKKK